MAGLIPNSWMPKANMKRIHVHWTAGGNTANPTDKDHYHILVEGDGKLVRGNKSIAANAAGSGMRQASHTLNANTGAIGISLCGMRQAVERPFNPGPSPLTKKQWDAAIKAIAELATRYNILVTPVTILTHSEVWPNLKIRQRQKWDINRLAFDDSVSGHREVGDMMRAQVAKVLDGTGTRARRQPIPDDMKLPRFRVTGVAPSTLNFRDGPHGNKKGELPERTIVERLAVIGEWWQVRTPNGHVGWVFSDFLTPVGR